MECLVRWGGPSGMSFIAETGSGHSVAMDGAADGGGRNLAPRPMELVLAGTGGCTAYDVVLILKRGRHDVRGCEVRLLAERAPSDPKIFTRIAFHFVVTGRSPAIAGGRGARCPPVARKVLFGHGDARKEREDRGHGRGRRRFVARIQQ